MHKGKHKFGMGMVRRKPGIRAELGESDSAEDAVASGKLVVGKKGLSSHVKGQLKMLEQHFQLV
jgi:hypothetical protein